MTADKYLDTLYVSLGVEYEGYNYRFLLDCLWKKEFYSGIQLDENRACDGLKLRKEFGAKYDSFGPARCLEVLIGLSKRSEFLLAGSPVELDWDRIFWRLISNLGLLRFDDSSVEGMNTLFEIDVILDIWMSRQFKKNGAGSPFEIPRQIYVQGGLSDQRELELWYQMQLWCELVAEGVV